MSALPGRRVEENDYTLRAFRGESPRVARVARAMPKSCGTPKDTMSSSPLVISHRTNMGTLPENTLAGVEGAIRDGADGVEIDVRATADGEIVLLHDANLARTTDTDGALSERTRGQLRDVRVEPLHAYQQPEAIPTLRETLAAIEGRAILVIEIKEPGLEERVARLVDEANAAEWCWVWAFSPEVCAAMAATRPELPISLNWGMTSAASYGHDPVTVASNLSLAGISLAHRLVDASIVARAHDAGLRVSTWTVNDLEDVDRVRDAGVDAICGDVPAAIAGRLGR